MKLLTLNFLTCAVKSCKNAAAVSAQSCSTSRQQPRTANPTDTDVDADAGRSEDPQDPQDSRDLSLRSEDSSLRSGSGSSFPLHLSEVELITQELEFNEPFWRGVLPRLDWAALEAVARECGLELPEGLLTDPPPESISMEGTERNEPSAEQPSEGKEGEEGEKREKKVEEVDEGVLRKLHQLLLETQVQEGWLVCGRCGHRYAVKEGIPNFLLPPHLV